MFKATKLYSGCAAIGDKSAHGTAARVFGICQQQMTRLRLCALTARKAFPIKRTHRI